MNYISLLGLQINGQDCQGAQNVLYSCMYHGKLLLKPCDTSQ